MVIFKKYLIFLLAILSPQIANASYLVDTGEPIKTNGGFSLGPLQSLAGSFSVKSDVSISSIEGFIGGGYGGTGTISIYGDGNIPGEHLYSADFSLADTHIVRSDIWQGVYGLNWKLAAGSYWIVFAANSPNYMSDLGIANPLSQYAGYSFMDHTWHPATQIKFGARISGSELTAVPEPSSWAMMILGLGAVGTALRARSRRVVAGSNLSS